MPRTINRCPECGQTVTPFAAGCAICGADLEAARAALAARRRISIPRPRWFEVDTGLDWFQIALAFLLALFVSPLGLLLALYWARQHSISRQTTMMWVMIAAAALATAALLAPVWFWSHVYGGI
jgi:hypothetical protein